MARGGRKTDYQWNVLDDVVTTMTANAVAIVGSLGFTFPGTIMRVRGGRVDAAMDGSVDTDIAGIIFGLGLVSTDAFNLGITAMPEPFEDVGYPWMWWKSFCIADNTPSGGDPHPGMTHQWAEIDTKAMRRFKPGQTLVLIAQYIDAVGTPPITVCHSGSRVLIGD